MAAWRNSPDKNPTIPQNQDRSPAVRPGTVRRPDRMLAAQLYQRGVALSVIENALVLAAVRRLIRPANTPPLGTVRSLAYFLPVINEVLEQKVSPRYFQYLRHRLARIRP